MKKPSEKLKYNKASSVFDIVPAMRRKIPAEDKERAEQIMRRIKKASVDARFKEASSEELAFLDKYRRLEASELIIEAQRQRDNADFDDNWDAARQAVQNLEKVIKLNRELKGGLEPEIKKALVSELLQVVQLKDREWENCIGWGNFDNLVGAAYYGLRKQVPGNLEYFKLFNDVQDELLRDGHAPIFSYWLRGFCERSISSFAVHANDYLENFVQPADRGAALQYMVEQKSPMLNLVIEAMKSNIGEFFKVRTYNLWHGNADDSILEYSGQLSLTKHFEKTAMQLKSDMEFLKTIEETHPAYGIAQDVLSYTSEKIEELKKQHVTDLRRTAKKNANFLDGFKP